MKLTSTLSHVRSFTREDIPQVAELHRRVFRVEEGSSAELLEAYRTYFTEVFLDSPWRDEDGSLVYEEQDGTIIGFSGTASRRLSFNGQPVRLRISSQFIVDPSNRGLVGLKLLSTYLSGSQDLSIGDEANPGSCELWEGFGGVTSHLYSMRWFYPLRPCQFARHILTRKRLLPPVLSQLAAPVAWTLDAFGAPILKKLGKMSGLRVFGEELTSQALATCLREGGGRQSLRPDYEEHSLNWVLERAGQLRQNGNLQKVLVRTERREIAGWYLYYLNPKGISEVLQLYANPRYSDAVLEHLFDHARRQGAVVLSGRVEPSMMGAFSNKHCVLHCGPEWTVVHSRRPELLNAIGSGHAIFSRLEGEWCLHFR